MASSSEKPMRFCEKCKKNLRADQQFYKTYRKDKYPDGYLNLCKQCLTMHVDNWNPETYLWILEECDVPYIPDEWNKLLLTWGRDRSKLTGLTIIGRYLSKMKLNQYNKYRWSDTGWLQEMADKEKRETMERQGYTQQQIVEILANKQPIEPPPPLPEPEPDHPANLPPSSPPEDYFDSQCPVSDQDLNLNLTEEEMIALRLKWGKTYRPEEWVKLEQLYEEMMNSYDIQSAGHIDTLKLVCKTSLKANQLLDVGDVDGAQKMVKMYDGLMKSGKFTAAQNKAESGEYVDSVSELVAICETEGFIPRYYVDEPKDKVDRVLQDLQSYTRSLVTEEMNLGSLIENAVKQIELDKEKEAQGDAEAADEEEALDALLFSDNAENVLKDEDIAEFYELEEEKERKDNELLAALAQE